MFSPTQRLIIQAILIIFLYSCLIFICSDFLFTRSLMGSIHTEVSHTALKLHLDYHNLQKLEDDPKKIEKMEPEFSQRSTDPTKPLQSPRISLITGAAICSLNFFDGNHRTLTCIQHDKRLKAKNFYPASKMSSKMSGSTAIKNENLT